MQATQNRASQPFDPRQRERTIYIGTAGWSIPRQSACRFSESGTHLQRYARQLSCAEINSSFHRPHAAATYKKWRDSTPAGFRFAVKVPRLITHDLQLSAVREPLAAFLVQTEGLAEKRGPLLFQLPPSFAFDASVVTRFLTLMREQYNGAVVCEPRHPTWFSAEVGALLEQYRIVRVAADPAPVPSASEPAGWPGVAYFRLHGSPRKYWSRYDQAFLGPLATAIRSMAPGREVWSVFDNTASGAAIENACELSAQLMSSASADTDARGSGTVRRREAFEPR